MVTAASPFHRVQFCNFISLLVHVVVPSVEDVELRYVLNLMLRRAKR